MSLYLEMEPFYVKLKTTISLCDFTVTVHKILHQPNAHSILKEGIPRQHQKLLGFDSNPG